ncbi:MAG: hypothetical protein JOZ42_13235 [Acetobacteraceae bacterium]|nr:hypothetical protein [Acetobacteraceae bacterium]
MDQVNRAVTAGLNALRSLFDLVLAGFTALENWLRTQLVTLGVPRQMVTVLLITAAIVLVLIVLRAFGGLIRVLIVLFLLLLLLHLMLPALHA